MSGVNLRVFVADRRGLKSYGWPEMFGHRQLKRRNQSVQRNKEGGRDRYAFRSSVWCTSVWGLISARHVAKTNDANGSVANALRRMEDAMRSGQRP